MLDDADRLAAACPYPFMTEQIDTWYGLALLLTGEDGRRASGCAAPSRA